jgi:energy-coupling factor transport system ATP-binding protein
MNAPIISLKNVSYRYPHSPADSAPALNNLNLNIAEGEFVGLVGANGSGKSTLARLLNGLLLPSEGEVLTGGMATGDHANIDRIREIAGMVFQDPDSQIVATSVEDDVAFGPENLGLPPEEIERRVDGACSRFGLEELRRSEPHWLSGGQKQRTVLAGVTALKPRALVLDEPTSMLDPRSQRRFREFIEELWRAGTTIIYITQLMEEIVTAPRVVALASGSMVFDGAPEDFFSRGDLLTETALEPPLAARLAAGLGARGRSVPIALTLPELVKRVWS